MVERAISASSRDFKQEEMYPQVGVNRSKGSAIPSHAPATTIPIHKPRGFWAGGLGSFCLFSTSFPFQDHVNRYKYFKHFHLDHTVISLDKTTGK